MADFHWAMLALNDAEFTQVELQLGDKIRKPIRSEAQQHCIDLFFKDKESVLPYFVPPSRLERLGKKLGFKRFAYANGRIEGQEMIDFSNAFRINDIDDVFLSLPLTSEEQILFWGSFDSQAYAVLAYSLGPNLCEEIDGMYGNMLIRHDALEASLKNVERIFSHINDDTWHWARRFISICSAGKVTCQNDDEIYQLFTELPKQMQNALNRGKHFAAFSFWMG